jgi:Skp family chaperone for outer membrane proteins
MRILSQLVALVLLSTAANTAQAADVIDRIVATVNGHVILQSDWDDAVRYEAFIEGRPLERLTDQDRGRALDRLIDQELVREQAQGADTSQPPADEVQQRIQELQKQHSAIDPSAWQFALAQYGLAQQQVEAWVAHDLSILHQVEARLRPAVQIAPQTIESYYRDTFLPQLRKAGAQDVPLPQVAAKIREILTEQKVNEMLSSWLQSLRSESKISVPVPSSSPPAPTGGQGQ